MTFDKWYKDYAKEISAIKKQFLAIGKKINSATGVNSKLDELKRDGSGGFGSNFYQSVIALEVGNKLILKAIVHQRLKYYKADMWSSGEYEFDGDTNFSYYLNGKQIGRETAKPWHGKTISKFLTPELEKHFDMSAKPKTKTKTKRNTKQLTEDQLLNYIEDTIGVNRRRVRKQEKGNKAFYELHLVGDAENDMDDYSVSKRNQKISDKFKKLNKLLKKHTGYKIDFYEEFGEGDFSFDVELKKPKNASEKLAFEMIKTAKELLGAFISEDKDGKKALASIRQDLKKMGYFGIKIKSAVSVIIYAYQDFSDIFDAQYELTGDAKKAWRNTEKIHDKLIKDTVKVLEQDRKGWKPSSVKVEIDKLSEYNSGLETAFRLNYRG